MLEALQNQTKDFTTQIQKATTLKELEQLKIQFLGKRGLLTEKLRSIKDFPLEKRAHAGQALNQLKQEVQSHLQNKRYELTQAVLSDALKTEPLDVSLPGCGQTLGAHHPLTQVRNQLESFFMQMGFDIKTGPEIERDDLNFTALNIPDDHPARALHDTFYLNNHPNLLLRTHTSTVQIHALNIQAPPLRIVSTGSVYRRDFDATHTPMFHQLECMVLDNQANFRELKGLLAHFLQVFFQDKQVVTRFRGSYFPFTEPSAEVDIQCLLCAGKKCSFCSYSGWLEVLGCGMIHPNVLRYSNLDPERYQGYAFGVGIERLTLLCYRIPDIRLLFENDRRLLSQFK